MEKDDGCFLQSCKMTILSWFDVGFYRILLKIQSCKVKIQPKELMNCTNS